MPTTTPSFKSFITLARAGAVITMFGVVIYSTRSLSYPTPVDFDGKLLRWNVSKNSAPITWKIYVENDQNKDYRQSVEDSMQLWSEVPSSYIDLEEISSNSGQPELITIHLDTKIDGSTYSSGYSVFDGSDDSGPTHCSIYVLVGPSEYGVAKTILHEMGHCLGLGHSLIPESIMSYILEQNKFALDSDDEAALSRLYPNDGSDPKLPIGCSVGTSYSKSGKSNYTASLIFIFMLLIPLFLVQPNTKNLAANDC